MDWSASNNDKVFGRYSFVVYESSNDERPFPRCLAASNRPAVPQRRRSTGTASFSSSLINELLVGYNQITDRDARRSTGPASATPTRRSGSPAVSRLPASARSDGAAGSPPSAPARAIPTRSTSTYQINEKVDLDQGRPHAEDRRAAAALQPAPLLRRQQRAARLLQLRRRVHWILAFSDFLLDQVAEQGPRQRTRTPWTHLCTTAIALFVQDDFKVMPKRSRSNLGLRWAYTQPVVESGQPSVELRPDDRPADLRAGRLARVTARSISRTRKASSRGSARACRADRSLGLRGGYGISQYMEGTGANLRLPLNPPFFFESAVELRRDDGRQAALATGFADLRPLDQPSGQVRAWDPNLRPQFTAAVERVRRVSARRRRSSANVGYVGHNATHLVTPVEGNQPLPGVGDPSTWAPLQNRRPLFATAPLITNISDHRVARPQRLQARLQASVRQRSGQGRRVSGVLHARQRGRNQPRLLRIRRRRRRRKAPTG